MPSTTLAQRDESIREALQHSPIAGGRAYQHALGDTAPHDRITVADCDVIVRGRDEFLSALSSSHDSIGIPGDESIDLTGESFRTHGKDIVSDRGVGGSDGALLYTRDKGINSPAFNGGGIRGGFMHPDGDTRLHGIRLRGASYNEHPNPGHPGYIQYRPPEGYNHFHARALKVHSDDVLIDNCEIHGWASAAVHIGSSSTHYSPTIAFNYVHDNFMTSAGYGVDCVRGRPEIRYNYFNAHRHGVCGFGFHDCSYVVEGNVFGPAVSSHAVDMHGLHNNLSSSAGTSNSGSTSWYGQAGGSLVIRNNTFTHDRVTEDANFDTGNHAWDVSIRGVPSPRPTGSGAIIERNRFRHTGPQPRNYGVRSFSHPYAVNQQVSKSGDSGFSYPTGTDGFTENVIIRDNQYNAPETPWEPEYGAPINLEDPDETAVISPSDGMTREQKRRYYRAIAAVRNDVYEIYRTVA